MNKYIIKVKKGWDWVWNSDSFLSWVVALVLIFLFVKFIFFPGLSLLFGTSLPLAGVESSSMDHQIVAGIEGYSICGNVYSKSDKSFYSFDDYWDDCGNWYINRGISKEEFSGFSLKNGFSKGDIIIVYGRFKPKVGDVIIFKANPESVAPRPIIHRIVSIEDGFIETKGDHNSEQLRIGNNAFNTDETRITEDQIIGKAIFRVPYLGWPKIWLVELLRIVFH